MKQKKNNVSARIVFVADKMVAKMKKMLAKKDKGEFYIYPAIEMETGLMLATDGQVLTVHKLKDYTFEPSDGAVLGDVVMLPVGALQMKVRVEVTVHVVDGGLLTVCHDEKGATAELQTGARYPRWRTVIPRDTGWPIDVDVKAWDAALKEIVPKMKGCQLTPVRLYGEDKSKTMAICWDNVDTDDRGQKDVSVGAMPFRMAVSLNGQKLRDVLAFQPTAMRFTDSAHALIFYDEDTLCLIVPVYGDDYGKCCVEKNRLEIFDLERWIGADMGTVIVDNTKDLKPETNREQTLEERLREALLKQLPQFRQAA